MKNNCCAKIQVFLFSALLASTSCQDKKNTTLKLDPPNMHEKKKPPSSYNDSFEITSATAIVYSPDSMQLEKIKSVTSPHIFDGQMHEYEYQLKYSRKVLKTEWPKIRILELKNIRFLLFKLKSGKTVAIDLNDYNDPYGIILFNTSDIPVLADMTNFELSANQHFIK